MNDEFILVRWPESQELMEYDWFRKECLLANPFDDQTELAESIGSSAYFVPRERYITRYTNRVLLVTKLL